MPDAAIEARLGESSRNPRTFATPMPAICGAHPAGFQLDPHDGETLHGLGPAEPDGHAASAAATAGLTAVCGEPADAGAARPPASATAATTIAVRARRTWTRSAARSPA